MDIKSWILLIGTLLIIAVICHGFWTAYQARKNDVRMDIETDIPQDDLDEMVLLRGELPNGGARVTPTVGFEALRMKERAPGYSEDLFAPHDEPSDLQAAGSVDPLDEQIALDDAAAVSEEGFGPATDPDEGNRDAGYEPEQATLDLDATALEERYAARLAAAQQKGSQSRDAGIAPLLTDAQAQPVPTSELPPKKLISPSQVDAPRRKQFEPPLPEEIAEIEAQREIERVQAEQEQAARERAQAERAELEAAAREQAEREAAYQAKVEAQRVARLEQEQREAQARAEAAARAEAKAKAKARAEEQARQQAIADQQRRAQAQKAREEAEAAAAALSAAPEQLSLTDPVVEFPETQRPARGNERGRATATQAPATPPTEELVVLNVIAKTRPFHGGDVLELFLRNGIKFGDMNIFHRIDPVSKASQYSIASVTEPGYFDLSTMEQQEFRGLCLFMQLPCAGQPTKVFTDMLTVAEKLARQLDAEVCDEQYNRLTRQSTEHFRQRVAEFTRRHMSKRAQST